MEHGDSYGSQVEKQAFEDENRRVKDVAAEMTDLSPEELDPTLAGDLDQPAGVGVVPPDQRRDFLERLPAIPPRPGAVDDGTHLVVAGAEALA